MYSYEQRRVAIELCCQHDGRAPAVVRVLGYPSVKQLRRWHRHYLQTGEIPEAEHRVMFVTLDQLMGRLKKAREENRLDRTLQQLTYPKLLIIDEIGYLPLSRDESSLFFRLVNRRYEKASTILTSNKGFADWGEVFGEQVIATAILDRLLHHATTINIKGESYRLKEKRRAGMLKNNPTEPTEKRSRRPLKPDTDRSWSPLRNTNGDRTF